MPSRRASQECHYRKGSPRADSLYVAVLLPMIAAAEAGKPLERPLSDIVAKLGFDRFMFGMRARP